MTDWFVHEPGRGRTGPFDDDALRARYRGRKVALDTLVWHADARDWQPLSRYADALGLAHVVPDAASPPPLPPAMRHAPAAPAAAAPRKGLPGCLVALLVAGALLVPMVGILAAIALPAYNDYVARAQLAPIAPMAGELQRQIEAHVARHGRCPGNDDDGFQDPEAYAFGPVEQITIGALQDGRCAFELRLRDGRATPPRPLGTLVYEAAPGALSTAWTCAGGTLPMKLRPRDCRAPSAPDTAP